MERKQLPYKLQTNKANGMGYDRLENAIGSKSIYKASRQIKGDTSVVQTMGNC